MEHKEIRIRGTFQNRLHGSHDRNVNWHTPRMPSGCDKTTQDHRDISPPCSGPQAWEPHLVRSVCAKHLRHTVCKPDPTASQTLCQGLWPPDLLTCRGHWLGTNAPVPALPVNRASLGDAEDSSFPSALPRSAGCEFTWLGTPSPHIPLSTPGHVERHGCVQESYCCSCFACS